MKEGLNPRDSDLHASPPAEALLLSGPVCVTLNLIRHRNAVMTENKEESVPETRAERQCAPLSPLRLLLAINTAGS